MNMPEHLLTTLSEECAEVVKEVSKALRFGMDDVNPQTPGGATNRQRIALELNHVLAMAELLTQAGMLPGDFVDREVIERKKLNVARYTVYARERGTLE